MAAAASFAIVRPLAAQDSPPPGPGPGASVIEPADVHVLATRIRGELELIRLELGRPKRVEPHFRVRGAEPRDVYFQGLTFFQRADRLLFEQAREHAPLPASPTAPIEPADCLALLRAGLQSILRVKEHLDIPDQVAPATRDATHSPSDVLHAVVAANMQLVVLLDHPMDSSDGYRQLTRAIGYASALLARFPEATRLPAPPPFERRKRPSDAYERLIRCHARVHEIAARGAVPMLGLEGASTDPEAITPSEVADIGAMLVADLAHLHSKLGDAVSPPDAYYPGRKNPSHVFQRAGVLERQLAELERLIRERPSWLSAAPR